MIIKIKNTILHFINIYIYFIGVFIKGYDVFIKYIGPPRVKYIIQFTQFFLNICHYRVAMIFSFVILPRVIILVVFIIEIFYIKQIHYYFYSLILLIIPFIFRFIIFILKDIGPRVVPSFKECLKFTKKPGTTFIDNQGNEFDFMDITMKPEYNELDCDAFLRRFYYPALNIPNIMTYTFIPKRTKITLLITYIYHIIHLLGWGYIIYTVLITLT